jgi:hypothetical protein
VYWKHISRKIRCSALNACSQLSLNTTGYLFHAPLLLRGGLFCSCSGPSLATVFTKMRVLCELNRIFVGPRFSSILDERFNENLWAHSKENIACKASESNQIL